MGEYDFSLRFDISGVTCTPAQCVELLAEAGCDDALVGTGIPGRIALEFIREAESAEDAVLSAISDVKRALPQATLIEATPDFVGYSDVADIVGKSRQNMRKMLLQTKKPGPIPVHEGTSAVWHLAPVLRWLRDEKCYAIDEHVIDLADTNMNINISVTQVNYGSPKIEVFKQAIAPIGRQAGHRQRKSPRA